MSNVEPRGLPEASLRVEAAMAIAALVHSGQVDRGGAPYLRHSMHVYRSLLPKAEAIAADNPHDAEALLCAAILHDAVEDAAAPGPVRIRIYADCGNRCSTAVSALTKQAGDTYEEYIERVCGDWIARLVKLADLAHNMDASRLPEGETVPAKYAVAYARLTALEAEHAR